MLIGHQRIWKFLTTGAQKQKLSHAFLFVGQPELGKKTLAMEFAKWLLCGQNKKTKTACQSCRSCRDVNNLVHPDFSLLVSQADAENKQKSRSIGISQIRELQQRFSLFPYSGGYKIVVIGDGETMTEEAGNAFLKTLEEPFGKTLIIITAVNEKNILPTIASRCQIIKFLPVLQNDLKKGLGELFKKSDIDKVLPFIFGRPGRAIKALSDSFWLLNLEKNRDLFKKISKSDLAEKFFLAEKLSLDASQAKDLLEDWLIFIRQELLELIKKGEQNRNLIFLAKNIQETRNILKNPSFNAKLAFENLMLKLSKT